MEAKPKGRFSPYKKEFKNLIKGKKKFIEKPNNKFYCYNCEKLGHVAKVRHNKKNGDDDNYYNKKKNTNKRKIYDNDMIVVIIEANVIGEEVD